MKLSDCKNKNQVNEFLKGEIWNLNGNSISREQIVVKRRLGVYTAYDITTKDEEGELFSTKEEARLFQIQGWMEYLKGKNRELRQKLDENNRKLKNLESEARDLKLYLAAQRNQDAQQEKAKAYKKENWK